MMTSHPTIGRSVDMNPPVRNFPLAFPYQKLFVGSFAVVSKPKAATEVAGKDADGIADALICAAVFCSTTGPPRPTPEPPFRALSVKFEDGASWLPDVCPIICPGEAAARLAPAPPIDSATGVTSDTGTFPDVPPPVIPVPAVTPVIVPPPPPLPQSAPVPLTTPDEFACRH